MSIDPAVIGMTAEEEIAGLKRLCEAWRKDSTRYESGLREVRKLAMQHYDRSDFECDNWIELIGKINSVLAFDDQCDICGDYHDGEVPRECQTGDGV